MRKLEVPIGTMFGRLEVVADASTGRSGSRWECRCACGTTCIVDACHLRGGHTKSCGCWRQEKLSMPRGKRTHNATDHPLYSIWSGMRFRCSPQQLTRFPDYAGRGITVCARWDRNFWDFVVDMGPRPDGMSLDRVDPNGNYTPDNCRWADHTTQARNKRPRVRNSDADVLKARIVELEWELSAAKHFSPEAPGDW